MPIRNETITVVTGAKSGGSIDNKGRWSEGVTASTEMRANVQPLSGKEILQLPEGDRTRQTLTIYVDALIPPNAIVIRNKTGLRYEILDVDNWLSNVIPHFKAIVALLDSQ